MKAKIVRGCVYAVAFVLSALRVGAEMAVTSDLTLTEDTDWRAQGMVTVAAGVTVDLNGHTLAVKGLSCAGTIVDSSAAYQPLEYVQVSGHQKVSTGYLTTDKTAIDLDFSNVSDFSNRAIFCGDWANYGHLLIANTAKVNNKTVNVFNWFGNNDRILNSAATNKRYRFVAVPGGSQTVFLYNGETGEQLSANNFSLAHSAGTAEMVLFAGYDQEPEKYWSSYRFHAFKLTDTTTGKVERDYVPVRVLAGDNAGSIGLYDRAYGQFYPNEGSQPFVAGNDVGSPLSLGKLSIDVADGALYAVSGTCNVRVELRDGSTLAGDCDLRCFGTKLEVNGAVNLNNHRLCLQGLGGLGVVRNGGYRYYRFKVDALRDGAMMQIGVVKLFCGELEVTRSYTHIDYNENSNFSGFTPVKCLDGNLGTKWFDNRSTDLMYFTLDYGEPILVTRYQWYTGDDTNTNKGRNPKSWRLQGSNDGESWQDVDVVVDNTSVTTANKTLAYDKTLVDTRNDGVDVDVPDGAIGEVTARLSGVLSLSKCGTGTVLVRDTNIADLTHVAIDAGCLKIKHTGLVGTASTAGEIRVANGAQLDINTLQPANMSISTGETTHGKTIYVEGDGIDSEGAIINTAVQSTERYGQLFGRLVLTGDASICTRTGTNLTRMDVRPLTGSAYAGALVEGAYTLTLNAGNKFDANKAAFALKELVAWGELEFEDSNTGVVTNGLRLCTGSLLKLNGVTALPQMPIFVEPDASVELLVAQKALTLTSPVVTGAGSDLAVSCSVTATFAGGLHLDGTLNKTGASPMLITGTLSGAGTLAGEQVRFSGTNTCWRLVANDDGFTNKVDTTGVADTAFLMELKKFEIVYTGEHPEKKVMTICPAGDFTPVGVNDITLQVTNAAGAPILNCWLEASDGVLKVHFADAEMPAVTAEWTNAADDGDVANAANWICRNEAGDPIPNRLPAESTVVLIGANNRFVCTNAAPLVCGKVRFEPGASLGADCDWRGLAGVPLEGTLNLAGHKLTVGSLKGNATLTDTAHGAGFKYYRFKVNKTRGAAEHAGNLTQSADSMQVCEVKFFNGTQELTRPYSHLFYNESTFNSASFGNFKPEKALDGDLATEWYDDRASSADAALREDVWFIVEYAEPIVLTHYEWYTGIDTQKFPYRQLQDWQLEGSNDLENWVLLDALASRMGASNKGLAYRGPAMAPTAPRGEVCIDVPAGAAETNTTVVLQGGLRLAKEGAGTFVAAVNQQTYAGGTVVREGVLKPALPVGNAFLFGLQNSLLTIEDGAQYWDDYYAPWATQYIRFRVTGTGPDGTGAIRTSHAATGGINNAEKGWLAALELTGDTEIARDAYAFSLIANMWLELPLTLNGHTLTVTSDTLTAKPDYPYFLASSLKGTPGDTGTIVIGDNIQFYPYHEFTGDLSNYSLVISEQASYCTNTDSNGRDLIVSNFVYASASTLSQTKQLTTVLGSYALTSATSAPKVKLGDAAHHQVTLDVSTRTTPLDTAQGGGLTFDAEATVTVKLGAREPGQMEPLVLWAARPTGTVFRGESGRHIIVNDTGIYYTTGLMIIVR